MKKVVLSMIVVAMIGMMSTTNVKAGEFDTGLDLYSSYIWRGAKFGDGLALQPWVEMTKGDFALGAWGSVNSGGVEALEMDLYASYSFGPVTVAFTDYYFGGDWTEFDMNHFFEPSLGFEAGDFSGTVAYMLYGDGSQEDLYAELAYAFACGFDLTLGGGDGQYTDDGEFSICNVSIGTSKDIVITETFTLPVSGAVTLNPSTGGFFISAGLSF